MMKKQNDNSVHSQENPVDQSATKKPKNTGESNVQIYTGLILVDLLHLDFRNFFSRYKVDLIGFFGSLAFAFLIVLATWLISRIGS